MESARKSLVLMGIAGVVTFSAGVFVASRRLPEWRAGKIPPRSDFAVHFQSAAQRAGVSLIGPPRFQLKSANASDEDSDLDKRDPTYRVLGNKAADWLAAKGRGPFVEASCVARWAAASGTTGQFRVTFSLRGEPVAARWIGKNPFGGRRGGVAGAASQDAIAALFAPISPAEELEVLGNKLALLTLPSTDVPESLVVGRVPGASLVFAQRVPASPANVRRYVYDVDLFNLFRLRLAEFAVDVILVLASAALFIMLLVRRRIDLTNGIILALLAFAFSMLPSLFRPGNWFQFIDVLFAAIGRAGAIFVLWSATESWIRSTSPGFRTSLDTLRAGRIGPQNGRALLGGWAAGAAVAGVWLMTMTASTLIHGVSPTDGSVHLPVFAPKFSPFGEGVLEAGFVLLAIGASLQLPVARRIPFCSTILGALFLATCLPISSFWFAFAGALVMAAVLVFIYARFGLSALLTATIVSFALPSALYGALHLSWLPAAFAATSALSIAPLALGLFGFTRPDEAETGEASVPAFVKRLEEERRVQYEMDLLARMQLGLLPQNTPRIEGYQLAARSLLATEAGGDLYDFVIDERDQVWIAAGDVSGHGYSCAIAQAMTKAGLASLIEPHQTPAAVLARLDRVLRTSGSSRTFTTLALLRLDATRGEGLIANAGHPYPMLASNGEVREISISALPLGQGPSREYENHVIRIEPGNVVVFCSDGVFEALNGAGAPYGFDRLRTVLGASRELSAEEILNRILDDWKKHIGRSAPVDDTTIVVLKRLEGY